MNLAFHSDNVRVKTVVGGKGLTHACAMYSVLNSDTGVPEHTLGLELMNVHTMANQDVPLKDAAWDCPSLAKR